MKFFSKTSLILLDIAVVISIVGIAFVLLTRSSGNEEKILPLTVETKTFSEQGELPQPYKMTVSYPQVPQDKQFNQIIERAALDYAREFKNNFITDTENPSVPYFFSSEFEIRTATGELLSTEYINSSYTGGAHPNSQAYGMNYDFKKQSFVEVTDIFNRDAQYLEFLSNTVATKIDETVGADELFANGHAPLIENFDEFTVTQYGVTFLFSPYQIAPYSAGMQRAAYSWNELESYLSDYGRELMTRVR